MAPRGLCCTTIHEKTSARLRDGGDKEPRETYLRKKVRLTRGIYRGIVLSSTTAKRLFCNILKDRMITGMEKKDEKYATGKQGL